MGIRRVTPAILYAASLACLAGCSKEEMREAFDKSMDQVAKTSEVLKERANLAGSIELTLDGPVNTGRCYLSLISPPSGRPAVLQISGYREPADETFPSIFLHAEVPGRDLAGLAGQKLNAQVYVQTRADGPVWHSPSDQPAELTITAVGDDSIEGQLLGGTLINTETRQMVDVTGKFSGSFR